ncbi:hypothetical protein Acsp04_16110 [Actinomadura sp. NBRC 104425]|nr:hypothetical protein Acsp04_16110 [Actinomadura sp. NBRC 104425]
MTIDRMLSLGVVRRLEVSPLGLPNGPHRVAVRRDPPVTAAGTGEPIGPATRMPPARQEIFHDPEHPSAIVLPEPPGRPAAAALRRGQAARRRRRRRRAEGAGTARPRPSA